MSDNQSACLHGVFMHIFNQGCFITGDSQSGKSELALSLIDRKHALVSDDMVDFIINQNKEIHGKAPALLKNILEVRHLGVINVTDHFGPEAVKDSARLDLVIILAHDLHTEVDRLTPMMTKIEILGTQIIAYELPIHTDRNLPVQVETIVREHHLQKNGFDATNELKSKHNQQLRQAS